MAAERIAVLGLGTMGHGIAQIFASTGHRVRAYDSAAQARNSLKDRIRGNLDQKARLGLSPGLDPDAVLDRIEIVSELEPSVQGADFVVEAVREDLPTKKDLFKRLEDLVSEETILASNTSTFPMTEMSRRLRHPQRTLVTHWFNPPHIIPLVEVVPGRKTSEETVRRAMDLLDRNGKLAIRLRREVPGFLVNRIQAAVFREIWDLVEQGVATPEQVDLAVSSSIGLRLAAAGPFEIADFAGLDITGHVFGHLLKEISSSRSLPPAVDRLVKEGRYGVKSGRGIYDYTPERIEERQSRRDRLFLQLVDLLHSDTRRPE
jgi:3-hydroxybutyryl-CoA dehydrogenase